MYVPAYNSEAFKSKEAEVSALIITICQDRDKVINITPTSCNVTQTPTGSNSIFFIDASQPSIPVTTLVKKNVYELRFSGFPADNALTVQLIGTQEITNPLTKVGQSRVT